MNFYERVYELVRRIPAGKCASYGQLARWTPGPNAGVVEPSARTTRWQGTPGVRQARMA